MERKTYAAILAGIYLLMFAVMFFDAHWNATGSFFGFGFLAITWLRLKDTNWPISNCIINCFTGGLYGLFECDRKKLG